MVTNNKRKWHRKRPRNVGTRYCLDLRPLIVKFQVRVPPPFSFKSWIYMSGGFWSQNLSLMNKTDQNFMIKLMTMTIHFLHKRWQLIDPQFKERRLEFKERRLELVQRVQRWFYEWRGIHFGQFMGSVPTQQQINSTSVAILYHLSSVALGLTGTLFLIPITFIPLKLGGFPFELTFLGI